MRHHQTYDSALLTHKKSKQKQTAQTEHIHNHKIIELNMGNKLKINR